MKNAFILSCFCLLLSLWTAPLAAQKPGKKEKKEEIKFKFGKPDEADVKMTTFAADTTAEAVVLYHICNISFEANQLRRGLSRQMHCIERLKILKPSAYERANIELQYGTGSEAKDIKGFTHNYENGAVVSVPLERKSIFEEKKSKYTLVKKFSLPQVKVGSVIEYEYTYLSPTRFTIGPHYFQTDIPVVWSELNAVLPDFYKYLGLSQNIFPYYIYQSEVINIFYEGNPYNATSSRWVHRNLPAFNAREGYLTTWKDYVEKVEMQLNATHFPGEPEMPVLSTWTKMVEELMDDENFGGYYRKASRMDDEVASIVGSIVEPDKKAEAIYQHVCNNFLWNGYDDIFPDYSLSELKTEKKNNRSGLNLFLAGLLKAAGLEAYPVLISTRSNGLPMEMYPIINKFNGAVACLLLNDKKIILDATSAYHPYTVPDYEVLNARGLMMKNNKESEWIILENRTKSVQYVEATFDIESSSGNIKGKAKTSFRGQAAAKNRQQLASQKGEDFVKENLAENNGKLSTTNIAIEQKDKINETLKINFDFENDTYAQAAGDMIYLNPMLTFADTDNPFKMDSRSLPIEIGYPRENTYIAQIAIPNAYAVESMPQAAAINLPDNAGKFYYAINPNESEQKLTLTSRIQLNAVAYPPELYSALKEFFTQIINKQQEQIVFKKK